MTVRRENGVGLLRNCVRSSCYENPRADSGTCGRGCLNRWRPCSCCCITSFIYQRFDSSKTAANSLLHAPTRRRFGGILFGLPELMHDNLWGVP